MKKLLVLSGFLFASLSLHSQAQTYLVDLFHSNANKYNGNAGSDFGITETVVPVGGSQEETNTNTPSTYLLGATGTLSLAVPSKGRMAAPKVSREAQRWIDATASAEVTVAPSAERT